MRLHRATHPRILQDAHALHNLRVCVAEFLKQELHARKIREVGVARTRSYSRMWRRSPPWSTLPCLIWTPYPSTPKAPRRCCTCPRRQVPTALNHSISTTRSPHLLLLLSRRENCRRRPVSLETPEHVASNRTSALAPLKCFVRTAYPYSSKNATASVGIRLVLGM